MTGNRYTQIGLDRTVRLAWLERVASLALAGNDAKSIKVIVREDLKESFQCKRTVVRGSIDKTITILLKVWLTPPTVLEPLRVKGLELLKHNPQRDHMAIHWGMLMAVYPFWSAIAIQAGRLLRLQGSVVAAHVQRRAREQYGERETVSRRVRYVLRSFLDWDVLQESEAKGVYTAGTTLSIDDSRLVVWLAEAALHARARGSAPLRDLLDSPDFFPFQIKPIHAESIRVASPRLDILRHGLDDAIVMLREQPAAKEERIR